MDARHFDLLTKSLTATTPRRRLLRLLATLPLLGGLLALLELDDAEARGRRKRRKKAHKHGKPSGRHRKGKRKCSAQPLTKVCAGKCGSVKNNCGRRINCGSCACNPGCDECFTCQEGPTTPGACVVDPARHGQPCGSDGQVCQAGGVCACDADSCANPTPICEAGACIGCEDVSDCVAAAAGNLCCAGSCLSGSCCNEAVCLSDAAPDCVDRQCVCAVNADTACADGETCCAASCADLQTDHDHCGDCLNPCSDATPYCVDGGCVACRTSADCEPGLVCDATTHVCRGCQHIGECTRVVIGGQIRCVALEDGSGQSRCARMEECVCPGTCADCTSDQICTFMGGDQCFGKNLCCPPAQAP